MEEQTNNEVLNAVESDVNTNVKSTEEKEDIKTFTQEQVNDMFSERLSRLNKKHEQELTKAKEQAIDEYKKGLEEDKRLAKMSESDRLNEELTKAKEQIKELEKAQRYSQMLQATRQELTTRELAVDDNIVKMLTTDDAETTKQNIDNLQKYLDNVRSAWAEERAKGKTPNVESKDNQPLDPFSQAIANIK